ncbi:MFS transporter [Mycolicibacterium litorale]|uniref:MFS transporter n=1 Tax=Mycolicibacterium litorale TaxID=758802 RepID=A0AAD1MWE1_9MYCO|nr:MFS transporter [Mycolicibacterium litorale]MCV7417477.1 MFS transporter [Mycolicibacterium litorale]TDY05266.1 putative MFS family arabinose efflux permease [Mycolicibacterium litorale]BBY18703.1 MFS transporter [Mycolicibacterium litorale]
MRAYRDVVRTPRVLNLTASQLFARLPLGMMSLAILLHVHGLTDSYAVAGAVVAWMSVGQAVAMPVTARLAGNAGMVPTLVIAALVNGASMIALALAVSSPAMLMALGLLVGASVPPLMPVIRALYPQLVPREGVRALFALDTTAQELIWVIGPVAATLLSSAVSTAFPLVASAGVTVAGTAWFLLGAGTLRPRIAQKKAVFGSVLLNRAVMLAMVASLGLVASFMALEVGIVAAMGDDGVTAGVAIALASVGSLVGGLAFGHRRLGVVGVVAALTLVGVGIVLFAVFDNRVLQFASLFLSGLGFAPALSALYIMVSREIEEHVATEAFGWLNSAMFVGGAIGTALAGVATEAHGFMGAVVVAALLAGVAALSPIVARMAGPLHGLSGELDAALEVDGALCAAER